MNYFLFFGPLLLAKYRRGVKRQQYKTALPVFKKTTTEEPGTLHYCEVCHRTEQSAPDLYFRVTESGKEYCTEHLPLRNKGK